MDSIAISGTLAVRIRTSFLKNENYFWQAMKQKECLIVNLTNRIAISVTHVTRIRNSFSQERGLSLAGNGIEGSSGIECLIADLLKRIAFSEFVR